MNLIEKVAMAICNKDDGDFSPCGCLMTINAGIEQSLGREHCWRKADQAKAAIQALIDAEWPNKDWVDDACHEDMVEYVKEILKYALEGK